jgi:hypothetical protein
MKLPLYQVFGEATAVVLDADDQDFAKGLGFASNEHAAYIVRACNAYPALLGLARDILALEVSRGLDTEHGFASKACALFVKAQDVIEQIGEIQ